MGVAKATFSEVSKADELKRTLMPLFANWKALIVYLLEDKNGFTRIEDVISISGDSINLIFQKDKTKIEATTLDSGELITLRYTNPIVPGYNEFSFGEHFYSLQFSTPPDYGAPGLEYNQKNIEGVKSILREGVKGKEVQYYKENIIVKSEVHFSYEGQVFKFKYEFSERSFWRRFFGKKVSKVENIEKKEIDLHTVFPPLLTG